MPASSPDDVVVTTPERVAFSYEPAGLGTRFLAQLVDLGLLGALMLAGGLVAFGASILLGSATASALLYLLFGFVLLWGYFLLCEAIWSGRTLGKRLLGLRVVGDAGAPVTVSQAVIRNLVRIVDFLPLYYAAGVVSIFISSRSKRIGDLAAGTIVVRERQSITLAQLSAVAGAARQTPAAEGPRPARWSPRLEPRLHRFVVAYARQRPALDLARRTSLAQAVEPALRRTLPDVVATQGALAALDQLADRQGS